MSIKITLPHDNQIDAIKLESLTIKEIVETCEKHRNKCDNEVSGCFNCPVGILTPGWQSCIGELIMASVVYQ